MLLSDRALSGSFLLPFDIIIELKTFFAATLFSNSKKSLILFLFLSPFSHSLHFKTKNNFILGGCSRLFEAVQFRYKTWKLETISREAESDLKTFHLASNFVTKNIFCICCSLPRCYQAITGHAYFWLKRLLQKLKFETMTERIWKKLIWKSKVGQKRRRKRIERLRHFVGGDILGAII